jgi:hypothetical protein
MFVWKESSVNTLSATYKNIGFEKQIKSKIQTGFTYPILDHNNSNLKISLFIKTKKAIQGATFRS